MAMPFFGSFAASFERRCAYSHAVIPGVTAKYQFSNGSATGQDKPYVRLPSVDGDESHVVVGRIVARLQTPMHTVDAANMVAAYSRHISRAVEMMRSISNTFQACVGMIACLYLAAGSHGRRTANP